MPLSVKVSLKNSTTNKALANTKVALFFYQQNRGRVKAVQVGIGQSDARGQAKFTANVEIGNYLPRALLKASINNKWQNLTALPKTYTASAIDFATVSVNTITAVNIAAVPYYGMANISLPGAAATVDPAKFKKIENENKSLTQKLTAADTLKEQQKAELSGMRSEITRLKGLNAAKPQANNTTNDKNKLVTTSFKAERVYSQAVHAINKADEQGQQSGRFRISDAKMTLKVLSGEKEDEVRLINNAADFKSISPELMSVIELNLADTMPVKVASNQAETIKTPKMPDVSGYTQSMALRKLAEQGLNAQTYQQQLSDEQVEKQASLVGQVLKQYPAPGKAINNPNDIALIIGTYAGDIN